MIIKKTDENQYQKLIYYSLLLFILSIPVIAYKYVYYFRQNQVSILKTYFFFLIAITLIKFIRFGKYRIKRNNLYKYILLYSILLIISILRSGNLIVSTNEATILFSYILIFFIITNYIQSEHKAKKVLIVFIVTASILSVYTILHYYGIITYLQEYSSVASLIGQKNWISNYLALAFPLALVFFMLEKNNRKTKYLLFFVVIIFYTCLMICQSRGVWVSIILTIITAFLLYYFYDLKFFKNIFFKNRKWLKILLFTFLVITIVYSTKNPINQSAFTVSQRAMSVFNKQDVSINKRVLIWNSTLEMIKDNPFFGIGIGNYKLQYLNYQADILNSNPEYIKYFSHPGEAHNDYLQMAAEMGLTGLLIYLLFVFLLLWKSIKYIKSSVSSDKQKILLFSLILGVICYLFYSLFTFPLHVPALGSSLFILLGIIDILSNENTFVYENSKITNIKIKPVLKIIFTALIILITLYLIDTMAIKPFIAENFSYEGEKYLEQNQYERAKNNFESAKYYNPYNGRVLLNLGASYLNLNNYYQAKMNLLKSQLFYNDKSIYNNLGIYYLKNQEFKNAREQFEKAIYIHPYFSTAYLNLGTALAQEGDLQEAIKYWERIHTFDQDYKNISLVYYNLAKAYEENEKIDIALDYYLKAYVNTQNSVMMKEIENKFEYLCNEMIKTR